MKIQRIDDIKEASDSNLLVIIDHKDQIDEIASMLKLDKNIIKNIEKYSKKDENTLNNYFLGNKHVENLHVIIINKPHSLGLAYTLGDFARKLPKKLTLFIREDQDFKEILKTITLSSYSYDEYKTKDKSKREYSVIMASSSQKRLYKDTKHLIENIVLARDLGSKPSNDIYPASFVKIAESLDLKHTKIKTLDHYDIKNEGLGLLEAVGKGSAHKPRLLIMEKITNPKNKTVAFIGKGITFDTGGIQVKPGNFMYEMKGDMCGGAAVLAAAKQLDSQDLDINVIYAVPLAESHISENAFKPSDIFTAYNGKTVDIIHTDAEGRLVLADALSYITKNYEVDTAITIATLTGACMHALGFRYAAIMGNDDETIDRFLEYSKTNFEKYSRLPFDEYFIYKTKSDIADLENLTTSEYAGTVMAGAFLANFVEGDTKFVHLDIAGTALNSNSPYGYANKGMTGFGVESVSEILKSI